MNWYQQWALDHIKALGIGGSGIDTVMAWEAAFTLLFTPEELRAATHYLIGRPEVKSFANEQRSHIINAIETARAARRQSAAKKIESESCPRCSGSGWAIVPHPGYADNGQRFYYLRTPAEDPSGLTRTMAVCCVCDRGIRTRADSEQAKRTAMTLWDYQTTYSNWQAVQEARDEVIRAELGTPHPADVESLKAEIARRSWMPTPKGAA